MVVVMLRPPRPPPCPPPPFSPFPQITSFPALFFISQAVKNVGAQYAELNEAKFKDIMKDGFAGPAPKM